MPVMGSLAKLLAPSSRARTRTRRTDSSRSYPHKGSSHIGPTCALLQAGGMIPEELPGASIDGEMVQRRRGRRRRAGEGGRRHRRPQGPAHRRRRPPSCPARSTSTLASDRTKVLSRNLSKFILGPGRRPRLPWRRLLEGILVVGLYHIDASRRNILLPNFAFRTRLFVFASALKHLLKLYPTKAPHHLLAAYSRRASPTSAPRFADLELRCLLHRATDATLPDAASLPARPCVARMECNSSHAVTEERFAPHHIFRIGCCATRPTKRPPAHQFRAPDLSVPCALCRALKGGRGWRLSGKAVLVRKRSA